YDSAGAMTRRYVHWDGDDVPVISYPGAGLTAPSYLHPDHQGSIIAISTASGVGQINRYDEYGIPAATNRGRFQYTGQAWLEELGLYHYKARIYSPTLGRFLQVDPVGYDGGINLYAYVADDPVNMSDPDGQNPAIDGRVAGLMSLSPPERLEALGYIGGALTIWLPGPEDVLLGAWLGRTFGRSLGPGRAGPAATRVWRPGQSPHALTRAGNAPSRRTVTRREWRNEAHRPTRRFTAEHMERMRRGEPPQRINPNNPRNGGLESMERAHEPVPRRDGGTVTRPLWPPEHEARDPCRFTGYCKR
ncbi:MAG TPA: RHS repeat-associated core domain-containing protein, partial [Allosphingosinicella sp.]|nr:RHS repeat-associated core domain-containing protein [Allosphingosinicella sp.]